MPRGTFTIGRDGRLYDSASEAEVANHLLDLMSEGIVSSYISHPYMHGMSFDFMVQLGPEIGDKYKPKSMCLLEYDGLAEFRTRDLGVKMHRNAKILELGIDVRWFLEKGYEDVKECLLNYTPPHLLQKHMMCRGEGCEREETIYVHAKKEENQSKREISGLFTCRACGGH